MYAVWPSCSWQPWVTWNIKKGKSLFRLWWEGAQSTVDNTLKQELKGTVFPSSFSVKYCSSGASKGIWVWCKLKWGARALWQQRPPCSLWNQPLLMAGEWLQELFHNCIPFRFTAKFGFHLKLILLACTLCSRGKETSRGKILLVRVSLGSFYLGPYCNQNLNVYLEVWGP